MSIQPYFVGVEERICLSAPIFGATEKVRKPGDVGWTPMILGQNRQAAAGPGVVDGAAAKTLPGHEIIRTLPNFRFGRVALSRLL